MVRRAGADVGGDGDPVGPPELQQRTLIRRFLERVDDYDAHPAFYEIGHAGLHRYADFGLTFVEVLARRRW